MPGWFWSFTMTLWRTRKAYCPAERLLTSGVIFPIHLPPSNHDDSTLLTSGPGGPLADGVLSSACSTHNGYAVAGSLPSSAKLIFSLGDEIVTFSYSYGAGSVIYSSIPLSDYLTVTPCDGSPGSSKNVYAPNVIAYAASLSHRNRDVCPEMPDAYQDETAACISLRDQNSCFAARVSLLNADQGGNVSVQAPSPLRSIAFDILTSCDTEEISFYLNETLLASVIPDASDCPCPGELQTFTISDMALLASAWNAEGHNKFQVVKFNTYTLIGWFTPVCKRAI
jgi:hypothetical protein